MASTLLAAMLLVLFGCAFSKDALNAEIPDADFRLLKALVPQIESRLKRNIEGVSCAIQTDDLLMDEELTKLSGAVPVNRCPLPNTRCDEKSGICECDAAVSVRLNVLPEAAICIPIAYVNLTGGSCAPSFPDICSVLVPGSHCALAQPEKRSKCRCYYGKSVWPNCIPRLGSPCQNSDMCEAKMKNSFCFNITSGFGTCQCPKKGTKILKSLPDPQGKGPPTTIGHHSLVTTHPSLDNTHCIPEKCPATKDLPTKTKQFAGILACNWDDISSPVDERDADKVSYRCTDSPTGYQCSCKPGYHGRSHNATVTGRCCGNGHFQCADFSHCIKRENFCDGKADCDDCSDEGMPFCPEIQLATLACLKGNP